jgi:hypothetical protein
MNRYSLDDCSLLSASEMKSVTNSPPPTILKQMVHVNESSERSTVCYVQTRPLQTDLCRLGHRPCATRPLPTTWHPTLQRDIHPSSWLVVDCHDTLASIGYQFDQRQYQYQTQPRLSNARTHTKQPALLLNQRSSTRRHPYQLERGSGTTLLTTGMPATRRHSVPHGQAHSKSFAAQGLAHT